MKKIIILLVCLFFNTCVFGEEIIKVRLSDGETISGRLNLPSNKDSVPMLVVFVHGTGPNTYLNKRKIGNVEFNYYDLFAEEFNKRGVGFFTYNRRGVEIGETPPYYDKIDSTKYSKYLPLTEAEDIEAIISQLKHDKRFTNSKIALLGASEGTIIASMVADRKIEKTEELDSIFDTSEHLSKKCYDGITLAFDLIGNYNRAIEKLNSLISKIHDSYFNT